MADSVVVVCPKCGEETQPTGTALAPLSHCTRCGKVWTTRELTARGYATVEEK